MKQTTHQRPAYGWRLLLSIDQFFNVLLSPVLNLFLPKTAHRFGNEDETLSSVFGKNAATVTWCYWMCRLLHLFDKGHCHKSIEHDEK